MPKITFEKEITEKQYALFQEMVKISEMTEAEYLWRCIRVVVTGDIDEAYDTFHPQRDEMMAEWSEY